METLLLAVSSIALVLSFLSMVWIYRCIRRFSSVYSLSAILIFLFACWEFIENLHIVEYVVDGIIVKLFIVFTAIINSYYAFTSLQCETVELVPDRRRRHTDRRVVGDRRAVPDRRSAERREEE